MTLIMPFDFQWQYEADENGDQLPANSLEIGDPSDVAPLDITIENILTDKDIILDKVNDVKASEDNYHFKLAFNLGILNEPEQIQITTENWSIYSKTDNLYLLWIGDNSKTLTPSSTTKVTLTGVAANATEVQGETDTTNLNISWNIPNSVEVKSVTINASQSVAHGNKPYSTDTTLKLKMVKTTGKSNVPLFVGFVGSNKVLNVNNGTSSLQLRITNTNISKTGDSGNIDFLSSVELGVMLEAGEDPWALGTKDEVNGITVSIVGDQSDNWESKGSKIEIKDKNHNTKGYKWTFQLRNKNSSQFLGAQETILIDIGNITTSKPTGETNLYLSYTDLTDYKDGQFICQIEKCPLAYDNNTQGKSKVGIGTTSPSYILDVDGDLNVTGNSSVAGNLNFGSRNGQMIGLYTTRNGIGIQSWTTYFRTSGNFAWFKGGTHSDGSLEPGTGGTAQMVINKYGNVGIGTTSPSEKLEVDGTIKTTDLNVTSDLNFGSSEGQKLNLWKTDYGIGIQDYTTYFRTSANFAWYKGGTHTHTSLDAGTGGTAQMVINEYGNVGIGTNVPSEKLEVDGTIKTTDLNVTGNVTGGLNFGTSEGQKLNLWKTDYGIGIQDYTTYFRSAHNFAWYKGGTHTHTSLEAGTGGTAQMVINEYGNVGIGTHVPSQKLEVNGTMKCNALQIGSAVIGENELNILWKLANSELKCTIANAYKGYIIDNVGHRCDEGDSARTIQFRSYEKAEPSTIMKLNIVD